MDMQLAGGREPSGAPVGIGKRLDGRVGKLIEECRREVIRRARRIHPTYGDAARAWRMMRLRRGKALRSVSPMATMAMTSQGSRSTATIEAARLTCASCAPVGKGATPTSASASASAVHVSAARALAVVTVLPPGAMVPPPSAGYNGRGAFVQRLRIVRPSRERA